MGLGLADLDGTGLSDARSSDGDTSLPRDVDGQPDYSYNNRDPLSKRGRFFDPRDLKVLADIIALNGLDESSSAYDYDDGDGVFDPTEFGDQIWCDGRLRVLALGPSASSTFGYSVPVIPESISGLEFLVVLQANASGVREIPSSIADMVSLEKFEAFGNGITEVPEDLGVAPRLRELNLRANQISLIPEGVLSSRSLQAVFVTDNPLVEIPAMVERQMEKISRGERVTVVEPIRRFNRNCVPGVAS